jgi:hypothetical protein
MRDQYTPVPDLVPGKNKTQRETDFFAWAIANCEYRETQKAELQPIIDGYRGWEKKRYGMDVAEQSIKKAITGNGYVVAEPWVIGLSLRGKDNAVPLVQPRPNEGIRVASPSPSLIEANNPIKPEPKPEITFVEAGPMPWARKTKDQ